MYLFNGNNLCSNNHHDLAMKKILTLAIIFLSFAVPFAQSTNMNLKHFPMLMPQVQPNTKDSYLCTAFRMPRYRTEYIVEFIPNATMETAHHIIIYGCKVPGYHVRDSPRAVWECGEMSGVVGPDSPYLRAPVCTGTYSIIYAWAMDAPSLVLPDKVGFKVGKGTDIAFLVLQVHYAKVDRFLKGDRDQSGIILSMTPDSANRVNKRAGVLLLGTQGSIPAKSIEHMETSCKISQPILMHPFAFRTHTHKLGKLVTGWLIEDGKWKLLGKRDPQKPQMFYPINNESLIIKENDVLAARCTMDNYLSHPVSVGPTGDDEMCNFYIMFWVDGDDELDEKYCFSSGPPTYYWKNDPLIGQVPDDIDREASNYIQ